MSALLLLQQPFESSSLVELNAAVCQDASRTYLITSLAIAASLAVAAVLLKVFLDKRHALSPAVRLWLPAGLAFGISTAILAIEPLKDDVLMACRESAEFSRYVFFGQINAFPRALVVGGCVAAVLYFILAVVAGLLTRPRN